MKRSLSKAIVAESPKYSTPRRAEITKVNNGFVVCGAYDPKTGKEPKFIAKTEEEAKQIASKLL